MKALKCVLILTAMVTSFSLTHASFVPLRSDLNSERPAVENLRSTPSQVEFEVKIPGIMRLEGTLEGKIYDRIEIPGGGYQFETGAPEVPNYTKLIALPATSGVHLKFEVLESATLSDIDLMPAQGDDPHDLIDNKQPLRYRDEVYSRDEFYPSTEIISGEPAIMRGVRLVPVQMNPVRYNPVTRELKIIHRFKVTVTFAGTDLRNAGTLPLRPMSRSWANMMGAMILNFDDLNVDVTSTGSYLIVCENDSYLVNNLLEPLIDWKKRCGHTVDVLTFSPNASNTTIKTLLQNYYNSAEIPPEFVLLVGDVNGNYALAGWTVGGWSGTDLIDHPYSQLEGNDILADVAIGRMPAYDSSEFIIMSNKVLGYERTPFIGNQDWYHQACLVAGNGASGISTVQLNRWIKTRLIEHEFTRIDTFWYWMSSSVGTTTNTAFNNGISCYNYRGCYLMENFSIWDISQLQNTFMLPFVVTITCGTGGFSGSESLMEKFFSVGTALTPTGAIASVGTATTLTHTRQNNTISYGTWGGILDEGLTQPGLALNRGKLELYNTFQANDPTSVSDFSQFAALAGDPGTELFTGAIQFMECEIPTVMYWGENSLSLEVTETGGGRVADATVCYYNKDTEMQVVGTTDENGEITLPMDLASPGNVKVTIRKHNYYPIVDSLDVIQVGVAVGYFDSSIDDDVSGTSNGDGDGTLNPAEIVEVPLIFKNFGSSTTASDIDVTATTEDPYVTLIDDYETFPSMEAGATANSDDDFDLQVASDCPDGHVIHLNLDVNASQGSWTGGMDLMVSSYAAEITRVQTTGGDTVLAAGSNTDLILYLLNAGGKAALSLTATLSSADSYITIDDNAAGFGTINPGAAGTCSADPFNITIDSYAPPGHRAEFTIEFVNSNGISQTATFSMSIGTKASSDPQGPDGYGYYCFDDTDVAYAQAPVYDWVEIAPAAGGSGTQLAINDPSENDDASVNVQLPFVFTYYGQGVNEMTVCSNGWVSAHKDVSYTDFRNYPIPSCVGPDGMIAPFWDDLVTWSSGKVYSYSDAGNHRYIIEWYRMRRLGYSTEETFQVILHDPAYYPTPTGDGEILFQYYDIMELAGPADDIMYSTIGIENFEQTDGIEVVYWNQYEDPAASRVEDGRAYLFTTAYNYMPGNPGLAVDLEYVSGSPIPAVGGNLRYDLYVENVGSTAFGFDGWVYISYMGGAPTTMTTRNFPSFQPGWVIDRTGMMFPVPEGYVAGDYRFGVRTGEHPDDIWTDDYFPFVKLGPETVPGFEPYIPLGEFPNPFDRIDNLSDPFGQGIPNQFSLSQNYPNPFNPKTTLTFALPEAQQVKLTIFNLQGQTVAALVDGPREAGVHEITFDASHLSSGLYFYRLEAGDFSSVRKMILMK